MKDGWKEAEDRLPHSYSVQLIQIKAKPHDSVFFFFHPCSAQKNNTLSTYVWAAHRFS